jgi:alcohol dehydrogenase YqhD (iron-dependent ADH family)
MRNFTFYLPTKLIFGPGEIEKLGTEVKHLGERAMIITGKRSASETGIVNKVTDLLEKD